MAEQTTEAARREAERISAARRPRRTARGLAFGAAAMGVVTATTGVIATPAFAESYPSWQDVQQAKSNVSNQQALVTRIQGLIQSLQTAADAAADAAQIAGEKYLEAKAEADAAAAKAADLQKQSQDADATAKTSQMRAGLLASHLARSGGQDVSGDLMLQGQKGDGADHLLYQLGTMSKLTEQSQGVLEQARSDRNQAQSLSKQATAAGDIRERLSDEAADALKKAEAAQAAAQAAVATQQQKSVELNAQLAALQSTAQQVQAAYTIGEQKRLEAEAAARAAAAAAEAKRKADAAAAAAAALATRSQGGGAASAPSTGGGNSVPNGNAVETAIAYARAQLGEPYLLGGEGPSRWDCSGLTMKAYAAAGIPIGAHYVSSQYYSMQRQGKLFPYSQRQRGDLLFWKDGGTFEHIGIYLGGGMMIAAPKPGDVVKIQAVWGQGVNLMGVVGRPAA